MKMEWREDTFAITELDPLTAELLRRIPGCAASDDEVARRRLFPGPTGGTEQEMDADWRETVEPELQELFATNVQVVEADLAKMKETAEAEAEGGIEEATEGVEEIEDGRGETSGGLELVVPIGHAGAWIHTINQARLALGARHNITEDNMNGFEMPKDPQDAFAVFQVDFYGAVLSFLVYHAEW